LINVAYAMGQGAQGQGGAGGFTAFIPLILMFVIFYFLLIRPQQKKAKEHKEMVASLKKGDRVVTSGGIHGIITNTSDETVTVEIADDVNVKINRGGVGGVVSQNPQPASKKKN
jgi:preprotein translocase subunit YajC